MIERRAKPRPVSTFQRILDVAFTASRKLEAAKAAEKKK
jgi:hypothetical protein